MLSGSAHYRTLTTAAITTGRAQSVVPSLNISLIQPTMSARITGRN